MNTTLRTPTNHEKAAQLKSVWAEMLAQVLQRGFHGTAAVEVTVQDGTVQTIRRRVEQVEK